MSERRRAPDALRVENIAKSFGAVTALVDVSMRLGKGEVLGLDRRQRRRQVDADQDPDAASSGPTAGGSSSTASEVTLRSVDHARSLGIDTVYQDLALVPSLSVAHNMFLKRELTCAASGRSGGSTTARCASGRARTSRTSGSARCARSTPRWRCSRAASARRSRSRARCTPGASILLLDEPLAAMGAREGGLILDLIQRPEGARRRLDDRRSRTTSSTSSRSADRVNLLRTGRSRSTSRPPRRRSRS